MAVKKYASTKDIKVEKDIINQVIGQDKACEIVRKAANQRRHVLLIGEPGTGKSMLGLGLAQLLPKEDLKDIISLPNPHDENQPLVRVLPKGQGRDFVSKAKMQSMNMFKGQNMILLVVIIVATLIPLWLWKSP